MNPLCVVIVPMRNQNEANALWRVNPNALKVLKGSRCVRLRIEARIDKKPVTGDVYTNGLPKPASKYRDLEFVRRGCGGDDQSPPSSARIASASRLALSLS